VDVLVEEGYDPVYGARPLKRVIQRRIENPLAQHILAGDYPPGSKVLVTTSEGEFQFQAAKAA
jgi:ATP-dependent Clp protease ATP-binding subunit ClpB